MASIDIGLATGDVMSVRQARPTAGPCGQIGHRPLTGRLVWRLATVATFAALTQHMRQTEVGPTVILRPARPS